MSHSAQCSSEEKRQAYEAALHAPGSLCCVGTCECRGARDARERSSLREGDEAERSMREGGKFVCSAFDERFPLSPCCSRPGAPTSAHPLDGADVRRTSAISPSRLPPGERGSRSKSSL